MKCNAKLTQKARNVQQISFIGYFYINVIKIRSPNHSHIRCASIRVDLTSDCFCMKRSQEKTNFSVIGFEFSVRMLYPVWTEEIVVEVVRQMKDI